jgi:hypothetical protein
MSFMRLFGEGVKQALKILTGKSTPAGGAEAVRKTSEKVLKEAADAAKKLPKGR